MSKNFVIVFLGSLVCFAALNLVSLHYGTDGGITTVLGKPVGKALITYGFPLMIGKIGGRLEYNEFHNAALIVNLAIAISFSLMLALVTDYLERRRQKATPDKDSKAATGSDATPADSSK